jgi:DNA-binding XRE family transcriptional regulator
MNALMIICPDHQRKAGSERREMMATSLHDKMKSVGSKRRKKIEARSAALIAEEMALRELRIAHHRTQASMAKQLGISQDGVSRLEKRSDLLLSTLRNYVEAMGGNLHLVAEFPDQPPVMLTGFSDIEDDHLARG